VRVCNAEYSVRVCGPDVTVEFPLPALLASGIVSTGNEHAVREMGEVGNVDSVSMSHGGCNVHFVDVISNNKSRMKTFERGAGWTNACGSGAVASVFKLGLNGRVEVLHDGGSSFVEITDDGAYLTVQPQIVFEGVWYE
jgi:diaminopimelate epimerase